MKEVKWNAECGDWVTGKPRAHPLGGQPEDPQAEEECEEVQGVGW